jgi:acetyl esterase/lipase
MHWIFRSLLILALFAGTTALGEDLAGDKVTKLADVAYKSGAGLSSDEVERCKLDVYLPTGVKDFPTLVWFHGGGLKGGSKNGAEKIARAFAGAGIAVVAPNYRLSPKATFPAYIQDAAAAVAWTKAHMAEHGGDAKRVFVSGHSAGGYLAFMLGLDARYLKEYGLELPDIAGFIPVSGQTMTHYTVREERGIGKFTITADEAAPVHFARKDTPPFLVLYADKDMAARAEENEYFVALMKGSGNKRVEGRMIADRNHGTIASKMAEDGDPGREAIVTFISKGEGEAR